MTQPPKIKSTEMNLEELRATRVPSKLKRELRRKYDKRHKRNAIGS